MKLYFSWFSPIYIIYILLEIKINLKCFLMKQIFTVVNNYCTKTFEYVFILFQSNNLLYCLIRNNNYYFLGNLFPKNI